MNREFDITKSIIMDDKYLEEHLLRLLTQDVLLELIPTIFYSTLSKTVKDSSSLMLVIIKHFL